MDEPQEQKLFQNLYENKLDFSCGVLFCFSHKLFVIELISEIVFFEGYIFTVYVFYSEYLHWVVENQYVPLRSVQYYDRWLFLYYCIIILINIVVIFI